MGASMVKCLQPEVANKVQPIAWKAPEHEYSNLGHTRIDDVSARVFDQRIIGFWSWCLQPC
jgi:hypothetical protein